MIISFDFQEREKRAASNKVLINSVKLSTQKPGIINSNSMDKSAQNNFMDSLMMELKQKKFATVPARRHHPRPGIVDLQNREYK